ncbi:HIT family protein [Marisediminicola senii]|uniref:HIT family protein n=1 Tax=Marisediminicola senii TaxID=2711233 RepID=UPI0013EB822A|nr:HIT family protein [Marisediminicola senii]
MPSVFTRIMRGELPGRFIWQDDTAVAFLTIEPRSPGHTLVVPRQEVDRWLDVGEKTMAHLMSIAHKVGEAQRDEWQSDRAGLMIEGYMVPHLHIHVWPSWSPREFHPSGIDRAAGSLELDAAAIRLRARMRAHGHGAFVPAD